MFNIKIESGFKFDFTKHCMDRIKHRFDFKEMTGGINKEEIKTSLEDALNSEDVYVEIPQVVHVIKDGKCFVINRCGDVVTFKEAPFTLNNYEKISEKSIGKFRFLNNN